MDDTKEIENKSFVQSKTFRWICFLGAPLVFAFYIHSLNVNTNYVVRMWEFHLENNPLLLAVCVVLWIAACPLWERMKPKEVKVNQQTDT